MKITGFEDLEYWQAARILVNMVYGAAKNSPEFQKDFRLSGQITAAAVSTMANTAEGFARRSNKEFVQFLFISNDPKGRVPRACPWVNGNSHEVRRAKLEK